jgi:membrane protease subunit (stomatin/prohibitin family)
LRAKINEQFKSYGLEVTKFFIENISLPPEVEQALDKRASMGALGDLNRYTQFQAAEAMRDAAQNPSGGAGLGASLGAGFAIGGQLANALGQGGAQQNQNIPCPSCGKPNAVGVQFCGECGAKMQVAKVPCVKCGVMIRDSAKFCSECGTKQEKIKCGKCGKDLVAGAKFCAECGTTVQG